MWQDYVLTAGSIVFVLALVPAVLSIAKPPRTTCAVTAAVLYSFAVTDWTLGLDFTAVTTVVTAAMWTALLLQNRVVADPRGLHCDDAPRA